MNTRSSITCWIREQHQFEHDEIGHRRQHVDAIEAFGFPESGFVAVVYHHKSVREPAVMGQRRTYLADTHIVPEMDIEQIPHGIPIDAPAMVLHYPLKVIQIVFHFIVVF